MKTCRIFEYFYTGNEKVRALDGTEQGSFCRADCISYRSVMKVNSFSARENFRLDQRSEQAREILMQLAECCARIVARGNIVFIDNYRNMPLLML